MTPLSEPQLIEWLSARGLSFDPEYGKIDFLAGEAGSRFWTMPDPARRTVYLLRVILDALDPWTHLMICKQGCTDWYTSDEHTGLFEKVHDRIVSSTGIAKGFNGALRVEKEELDLAITLLFNQLLFGWCAWDDVDVIPDHGRQVVSTSHHDVVWVRFAEADRIEPLVRKLYEEDFPLPEDVPDATFKTPHWMKTSGEIQSRTMRSRLAQWWKARHDGG